MPQLIKWCANGIAWVARWLPTDESSGFATVQTVKNAAAQGGIRTHSEALKLLTHVTIGTCRCVDIAGHRVLELRP